MLLCKQESYTQDSTYGYIRIKHLRISVISVFTLFFELVHETSVVFRQLQLAQLLAIDLVAVCVGNLLQYPEGLGLYWSRLRLRRHRHIGPRSISTISIKDIKNCLNLYFSEMNVRFRTCLSD